MKTFAWREMGAERARDALDFSRGDRGHMFTQQHYEAFARTIEDAVIKYDQAGDAEGRRVTVEFLDKMIAEFEKDNPKFKKLKFIETALAKANAYRDGSVPHKE